MKNKKKAIIIGIIAAAVLLVACLVLIIGVSILIAFRKPTIDINKYVTIESEGYDGYGNVTYTIDQSGLKSDYRDVCKFSKGLKNAIEDNTYSDMLEFGLSVYGINVNNNRDAVDLFCLWFLENAQLSQSSGVSNGDTVTFSWNLSDSDEEEKEVKKVAKMFGVKIKYSDIEYKVDNLKEVPSFDPFDGVEVSFSGMSPNGRALLANYPENGLWYSIDKSNGLKNGDEITVSVEAPYGMDSYIRSYEKKPSDTSKTYKVEDLPEYITSASQISSEVLAEMKTQTEDIIQGTTYGWNSGYTLTTSYVGNYFLTAKQTDMDTQNMLVLVYKLHYQNSFKDYTGEYQDFGVDYYYYVNWDNIYIDSDGQCKYDSNTYWKTSEKFTWNTGIYQDKSRYSDSLYNEVRLTFTGYLSLDSIYDRYINRNIEYYKFEDNITV